MRGSPYLRGLIEQVIGAEASDLVLTLSAAAAQGFAQSATGPVVDICYRLLFLAELASRRSVWVEREPELSQAGPVEAVDVVDQRQGVAEQDLAAQRQDAVVEGGPAQRAGIEHRDRAARRVRDRCHAPTAGRSLHDHHRARLVEHGGQLRQRAPLRLVEDAIGPRRLERQARVGQLPTDDVSDQARRGEVHPTRERRLRVHAHEQAVGDEGAAAGQAQRQVEAGPGVELEELTEHRDRQPASAGRPGERLGVDRDAGVGGERDRGPDEVDLEGSEVEQLGDLRQRALVTGEASERGLDAGQAIAQQRERIASLLAARDRRHGTREGRVAPEVELGARAPAAGHRRELQAQAPARPPAPHDTRCR